MVYGRRPVKPLVAEESIAIFESRYLMGLFIFSLEVFFQNVGSFPSTDFGHSCGRMVRRGLEVERCVS